MRRDSLKRVTGRIRQSGWLLCLIALVVGAGVSVLAVSIAGGSAGEPRSVALSDDPPADVPAPAPDIMVDYCNNAPPEVLSPDGPNVNVFDTVTLKFVTFDAREYCRAKIPLSPDPKGDLLAEIYLANGTLKAHYYLATRTNTTGPNGEKIEKVTSAATPLPDDVAQQMLAEQKAASPSQ